MEQVHTVSNLPDIESCIGSNDNSRNLLIESVIPEICKGQPCVLGIDEAGRGPVLGPMVYGTAFCPTENNEELLKKLGCADSKALTEKKRDDILESIFKESEWLGWMVEIISPNVICNSMLRRQKYSLNEVSHDSAIGLIRKVIDAGVNVREVFVDTVGPPESYKKKLSEIFPELNITVASKADALFPVVGAASICAKVSRDLALKLWKFNEGIEVETWGSGYPGDPVTKRFLSENIDPVFGFPQLVRFSWSTASKILKEKAVLVEGDEIEDDDEEENKTRAITSFFKPKAEPMDTQATPTVERHAFFKERCLQVCTSL
uniref:Ribonuclease n=1 Tax=Cacopsylla melanoneura TaxID=428564 RepID=A0A8D8YZG3_9HEMI